LLIIFCLQFLKYIINDNFLPTDFMIFLILNSGQELPDGAKLLIFLFRFVISAVKWMNIEIG